MMSLGQRGLWYFHQLLPNSAAYNVPFRILLEGNVEPVALARALDSVVARHEVLRTIYLPYKGSPLPVLLPKWSVELKQADLRSLPAAERERESDRVIREQASRPFSLARDVMVRALLVRLEDEKYWFFYNFHHIAFDGHSMPVLHRDVAEMYNAFLEGREPELPAMNLQYSDFARWQQARLSEERVRELSDFWREQLSGAATLNLPADLPRPASVPMVGSRYFFHLRPDLLATINQVLRDLGATTYRGLLAAFNVLLYCYTEQTDISIGSPFVPRTDLSISNLMGFFVTTVVLRNQFSPRSTFRELTTQVAGKVRAAVAHCELPFEQMVDAVHPARDPGRTPLFQVNFRAPKEARPTIELNGVKAGRPHYVDNGTSKFDLALELDPVEGLQCYFEYRTDLFRDATISQMVADFESVLAAVLAEPDTPLKDLRVLNEVRKRNRDRQPGHRTLGGLGGAS
jgi:hypothetical protein